MIIYLINMENTVEEKTEFERIQSTRAAKAIEQNVESEYEWIRDRLGLSSGEKDGGCTAHFSTPFIPKNTARLLDNGYDVIVTINSDFTGETRVAWLMARQDRRGLLIIDAPETIGTEYKEEVDLALNELGVRHRNVDE
ncbi:MAG: hypothetical protein K6D97_09175, partial [Clostridia bacterium]|nr:hypothetical protein [Clostridia bacterium]